MVEFTHYIPVLYWRKAERLVLREICLHNKEIIGNITPLVQLYPPDIVCTTPLEKKVLQIVNDIHQNWDEPLILDPYLLPNVYQINIVKLLAQNVYAKQLSIIPAIHLNSSMDYRNEIVALLKGHKNGVCIRINQEDLINIGFQKNILTLLSSMGVQCHQVDLIVDAEYITQLTVSYDYLLNQIPNINDWRMIAFIGGSFPKDFSSYPIGTHHIPRVHWQQWLDLVSNNKAGSRKPCYGDYTVRHPIYEEPPRNCNPTASIFYTLDNDWLLMRGEQERNEDGSGFLQYYGNAMLLIDDVNYKGPDFSRGDWYIHHIGSQVQPDETGNRATWIRAGINHHIVQVITQLGAFFGT